MAGVHFLQMLVQLGFILVVSVFVDAFIVRCLVVTRAPAGRSCGPSRPLELRDEWLGGRACDEHEAQVSTLVDLL